MEIYQSTQGHQEHPPQVVSLLCPKCKRGGNFSIILNLQDILLNGQNVKLGIRICPHSACKAFVFVVMDTNSQLLESFPPELIDFDATDIPEKVIAAFSEALLCHAAQCYIASALMIRKTLEELCEDKGAMGDNLKKRIKALKDKVIIPLDLLTALDEIRLLGNDAAHVKSHDYDDIGKEEVEVFLDFTKEVLKAVYQYSSLVQRIKELKSQKENGSE